MNLALATSWSNLAICLHGLNAYSLLKSTFEMALNFENNEVLKKRADCEQIVFPKFDAFQFQPGTRKLDDPFEPGKPRGGSVLLGVPLKGG